MVLLQLGRTAASHSCRRLAKALSHYQVRRMASPFDALVRQRGELGLVVDLATHTVITVIFRDYQRWISLRNTAVDAA